MSEMKSAEMKWNDCMERMPDPGESVLTVFCGCVQKITYSFDGEEWVCADEDCDPAPKTAFTHWMPLPTPPEVSA